MLYLAIDLHRKQMTINLRGEDGEPILRRQVGTWARTLRLSWPTCSAVPVRRALSRILEVCGFHDWLTELLPKFGCREVVLIQAEKRSSRKTDRRDANQLGELVVAQSGASAGGPQGAGPAADCATSAAQREDRRLTQLRLNVTVDLTRTINRVKYVLRRLNIEQHCPTKGSRPRRRKPG